MPETSSATASSSTTDANSVAPDTGIDTPTSTGTAIQPLARHQGMHYRVYGDHQSGNCYKIELLMHLLGIDYEWIDVDILKGETQTAEFKEKNPTAKIPLLQIGEDTNDGQQAEYLSESNAILNYLAEDSDWLPHSGIGRARVLQWQSFEQYSHEPYIAVARYISLYLGLPDERKTEYLSKQAGGHRALAVMEEQLALTPFITGSKPTIADISLYAYTHVAHEGGFDLAEYPAVERWLEAIRALPGYIAMAD